MWNEPHSEDFKSIIQSLCENDKLLHYYRPDLELFLKTDASGIVIGMALLQSDKQ